MYARLHVSTYGRRFYLASGCLILVAWGLLIAWQRSVYGELLGHEAIEDHGLPPLLRLGAFTLGWLLMTVAMMLPGSLPLLKHSLRPVRRWVASSWLAGLTILGYLAPWAVFGMLVYLGDSILHQLAAPLGPLAAFSGVIAPATVLMAGFYQLTPAKRSSIGRCLPGHDLSLPGKFNNAEAFQQGMRLGVSCVGSCWSMMLLMSAVGHNRLEWMLAFGGILAAERLTPWGQRLAWLVGVALILWATAWMLASPLSGHNHP